jgi:hypothetical protein
MRLDECHGVPLLMPEMGAEQLDRRAQPIALSGLPGRRRALRQRREPGPDRVEKRVDPGVLGLHRVQGGHGGVVAGRRGAGPEQRPEPVVLSGVVFVQHLGEAVPAVA